MKVLSLSSKKKTKIFFLSLAIILLGFVVFGSNTEKKNETQSGTYHISRWNGYRDQVDEAVKGVTELKPIELSHVYGMVVPHHIPTAIPKLVEYYVHLKNTQTVKNIIVIGPDHNDAGDFPTTVSNASFYTAYGEVKPIEGLAEKLTEEKLANIEESPFPPEHSVGSQILLISKIFPDAKVTPIIVRSDTSRAHVSALGKMLGEYMDEETILVASVDFSHYLATDQAMSIDQISKGVLENLDLGSIDLVKADSSESMLVFMEAMNAKHATQTDALEVLNTNDLMQNSDYTTGYVFGYWGTEK